ncbi:PTS sugar transporter subunit IIA [Nitratireductor aquimarinus]|uniref:PTS sugar transporter subunit IIA n=1 Tax=Nitratireductor aquimarinus TaxID=889300 RepID=UPI00398E677B
MGLSDFLSPSRILLGLGGCKKRELIGRLAEQFAEDLGGDASAYAQPLLAREKLGSTAIGKGIALPHGKAECLSGPVAAAAVLRSPANFDTPDGVEVDVVIAFLSPDGPPKDLDRIRNIVRELRSDEVRQAIRTANTPEEIMADLARNEDR